MKKKSLYLIIITLFAAAAVWFYVIKDRKSATVDSATSSPYISKHSGIFHQTIKEMMDSYFNLTENFVNWDTSGVAKYSVELNSAIENLKIEELKIEDPARQKALSELAAIKTDIAGIIKAASLEGQRESLNLLSRSLYQFLQSIRYDIGKIYYQECPMAFNDVIAGNWLSNTDAVRNPYLGTKHPKYKSGMLKCGGPRDTLNFMQ